jgi:hypothetical protein
VHASSNPAIQGVHTLLEAHRRAFLDCYGLLKLDAPVVADIRLMVAVDHGGRVVRFATVTKMPLAIRRAATKFEPCIQSTVNASDFSKVPGLDPNTELVSFNLSFTRPP